MRPFRPNTRRLRLRHCLCPLLVLPALLPAAAAASPSQVSIIQDDALLFSERQRGEALRQARALGADWVHVVVRWDRIAPHPDSRTQPSFDDSDPGAYPAAALAPLDAIVRDASTSGLEVLLTPSGPGPRWASAGGRTGLWKPSPELFGRFVEALARRYSGTYAPDAAKEPDAPPPAAPPFQFPFPRPGAEPAPDDPKPAPLPRVSRWSVWNEPNQPGWLRPQFERGRPESPHRYRRLFRAAGDALKRTGHGSDLLLVGETAPLGDRARGAASKMRPGLFLRELFCLGSRHSSCRRPSRLAAGGLAHHPYVKFRSDTPRTRPANRDDFPIGATGRLIALLDRAGRAGRAPRRLGVYFTEFGWQSSPPDHLFGVPLALQARYINESEHLAYNWPRVRSSAQYLLNDEPDLAGFQTGLRYESGRPKPALGAFRMPLVVRRSGRRLQIWGLVRPAPAGQRVAVRLLRSPGPGRPFRASGGSLRTTPNGAFTASRALSGDLWRARWRDGEGKTRYSRVATR